MDFKGDRARLNLRLDPEVALNLLIIKLATGVPRNTLCETYLREASDQAIAALQEDHDPDAWATIITCAKKLRGP